MAFVRDGDSRTVWDPGMVPSDASILGPLRALGVAREDVTEVVLSHHHPDHTMRAGLFPNARVYDRWAWYRGDEWVDRPCEGFEGGPRQDPHAVDPPALHAGRKRVLSLASLIVSGHGAPFRPSAATPI